MKSFDDVWVSIVSRIRPGDEIKNWGNARGYTGGTFKIEQVHDTSISVFGGAMTEARNVPKGDFKKVYGIWEEYVAGNYRRGKLRSLSQNSTYFAHLSSSCPMGEPKLCYRNTNPIDGDTKLGLDGGMPL